MFTCHVSRVIDFNVMWGETPLMIGVVAWLLFFMRMWQKGECVEGRK